jgi:glycosyltransferase involved in cell wall biosynthesis
MSSNETHVVEREASPLVTVVIPTFRRHEQLLAAIASVVGEGVSSFEILVIDDSPEQSARDAVATLADPRIVYLANPEPSGGRPALVRNLGIERARSRYLYFLDDDDQVVAGGLTAGVQALEDHPSRGVAFGTVRCVGPDATIQQSYERWFRWAAVTAQRFRRSRRLTVGTIMFRGTLIINSCCVIRTERARQLGGYDARIPVYEDVEFFTRGIRAFGHVFVDVPILRYSTGLQSIIHDLHGNFESVRHSYRMMHDKYKATYGLLDYRAMQVVAKLLPIGKPS